MICEACGKEAGTIVCKNCGMEVCKLGPYCYLCGAEFRQGPEEAHEADDFSARILCSDGACIGVINEEGVCKVCGKPYRPES
jgi:hypothetical protein